MKWKIIKYISIKNDRQDTYLCENEEGKREYIDFFTSSSHKGFGKIPESKDEVRKSIVGRTVEIEELSPYTPLYKE